MVNGQWGWYNFFVNLFQTIILSLVEGVTEYLPISSTGHLILTSDILQIPNTEFVKSFMILIQLGAILSVIFLYYKDLLNKKIWLPILTAFIPSAVVGLLLYHFIKSYLLGNSLITVIMLFIGGVAFIVVELWNKRKIEDDKDTKIEDISLTKSFALGIFQSISVIPGTSRAGSTILGGLTLGISRKTSAEFSFILAIPTMLAASALDIYETKLAFSSQELTMLVIGFILSFIFAALSIKFLIKYLANHTFIPFGIYRIVTAVVFYLVFIK